MSFNVQKKIEVNVSYKTVFSNTDNGQAGGIFILIRECLVQL